MADHIKPAPCPACGAVGQWEQNGTIVVSDDVDIYEDGDVDYACSDGGRTWWDTFEHSSFECKACSNTWNNAEAILAELAETREAGPFG